MPGYSRLAADGQELESQKKIKKNIDESKTEGEPIHMALVPIYFASLALTNIFILQ